MKRGTWLLLVLAASLYAAATPAGAATATLGRIAPMGVPGGCSGCTTFQLQTDPASPSYVVPPGGPWTITSWSARGGPTTPDSARLRVFRATAAPGQVALVAESAETPIGVVEEKVSAVSIPVKPGDVIGLRTFGGAGDMPGIHPSGSLVDQTAGVFGNMLLGETAGPGGTHAYGANPGYLANVAATLTAPDPQAKAKAKCKKRKKKPKAKRAVAAKKKKKKKCRKRKKGKKKG